MNKLVMLRPLVAPTMLVSLILVAVACGEGAKPTAAPVASGAIEGVVKDADGRLVVGIRLLIVEGTAPFPEKRRGKCTGIHLTDAAVKLSRRSAQWESRILVVGEIAPSICSERGRRIRSPLLAG